MLHAVAETYVVAWRVDDSKNLLASLALFLLWTTLQCFSKGRCIASGDTDFKGLYVSEISDVADFLFGM